MIHQILDFWVRWREFCWIVSTLSEVGICLNRLKYARDLSFYFVQMRSLKKFNVEAFKYFHDSGFSGSLTGRAHSSILYDQVIDQVIWSSNWSSNWWTFTDYSNDGGIEWWARTHHLLAALLSEHMNKKLRKKTYSSSRYLQNVTIQKSHNDAAAGLYIYFK